MITKILAGLTTGIVLGYFFTPSIFFVHGDIIIVLIFVALDSIVAGLRASTEKSFNDVILITEFFTSSIFATSLTLLGNFIGLDIRYIILIAFCLRIFKNLSAIQQQLMKKE